MSFAPEPTFTHGAPPKAPATTAILLCNLGTPDEPTAPALRRYLGEFLSDARVVEIPRAALVADSARHHPAHPAEEIGRQVRQRLAARRLAAQGLDRKAGAACCAATWASAGIAVEVRYAMRYGNPSIASQLDQLKADGVTRVLILPAYPQYSGTTTASVFDAVYTWAARMRRIPEFRFINHYHDDPGYIAALADKIRRHWQLNGQAEQLVMSFHGVPERTLHLGDPYHCECQKTARLLADKLALPKDRYKVTFQSRFGKAKWLEPYTEPTLVQLAQLGRQKRRRGLPRLHRRLPGNAGRNQHGSAPRLFGGRRQGLQLHRLPERQPAVAGGLERAGHPAHGRLGDGKPGGRAGLVRFA